MPNICYNHIRINGSYWDLDAIRKRGRVTFMVEPSFIYKDRTTTIETNEFSLEGFVPAPPIVRVQYQDPNDPIAPAVAYCERHGLADQKIRFLCGNKTGEANRLYSENPSYWYRWCVDNWGTKWDTWDAEVSLTCPDELVVEFKTAWCPPDKVLKEISRLYPNVDVRCHADIEGCRSVVIEWRNGKETYQHEYDPELYGITECAWWPKGGEEDA